jgi:hypothetical protein
MPDVQKLEGPCLNRRTIHLLVVIVIVAALLFAPAASASPQSPLCEDGSWRQAHPLICDTGGPLPNLGGGGSGGSGGDEGLIGRIIHAIGGLL